MTPLNHRALSSVTTVVSALVSALVLTLAGITHTPAVADPVDTPNRTPGLDEVFGDHVISTFTDGRVAAPSEIIDPLRPVSDDFYSEPELTGDEAAGTLLKTEPVQVQFAAFRPGNLRAWRTMYVTREMDGSPSVSTGILLIPDDGRDDASRTVIGYQEANDSVGARCHPSTQWTGSNPLDGSSWSALGPLAMMFERGWAVSISDVGNDAQQEPHGVFAGKYAGNAMLDGVRSALSVKDIDLSPDAPVGLFGIAGGGVGAAFAAEQQAEYAPELNVKATVLEGMVVNQRNFIRTADGSVGAGFAFATLVGLEAKYPEMDLDSHLTPLGRTIADEYRTACQTPTYFTMPFVPLSALFTSGVSPADNPAFRHVYDDNLLGAGTAPSSPVLIASCSADDSPMSLVPAADARKLATAYREGGTPVSYQPTDCSMQKLFTDPYGWGTDLFGMQTVDWLEANVAR